MGANMSAPAAKPKAVAKKPKAKPTHPPTSSMVVAAIKALKERGGSSLPAIKKYIAANYKVDVVKLSPFIRKALKKGVEKKTLVQVKASYKLGKVEKPKKAKEAQEEEGQEAKGKEGKEGKDTQKGKETSSKEG